MAAWRCQQQRCPMSRICSTTPGVVTIQQQRCAAPHLRVRTVAASAQLSGWWPFGGGGPQGGGSSATMQQPQHQTQRRGGAATVVREVHADELKQRVQQHNAASTPLIIMFTAEWCGPCTLVHKELLKLGAVRPKGSFEVLALDVDASEANSQLATELAVYTLPTLIFVGKGGESKPAISTTGNVSMSLVADVLDSKMAVCGASIKNRLRM